jgi:hypothetical protein
MLARHAARRDLGERDGQAGTTQPQLSRLDTGGTPPALLVPSRAMAVTLCYRKAGQAVDRVVDREPFARCAPGAF